jgi:hypothetical protein
MCGKKSCKAFNEKYEYNCAINNFAAIRACREYHKEERPLDTMEGEQLRTTGKVAQ